MTKEQLREYRALRKEIALLDSRIRTLEEKMYNVPTVMGKVTGSSKDHPYIPVHMVVEMDEPQVSARIKALIWLKKQRRASSAKAILEIEEFIAAIPKAETRIIFEMVYQDGISHEKVGEAVGIERSSVTKKINDYLKLSHNSQ